MSSEQRELVERIQRTSPLDVGGDLDKQRDIFDEVLRSVPLANDVRFEPGFVNDTPVVWTRTSGATEDAVLVYLHGGAFALGSAKAAAGFAAEVGRRTKLPVAVVEYRLAPECPFPAARDDLLSVIRGLQASGIGADRMVIMGDSAGGGVVMQAAVEMLRCGLPVPAALALISPWLDLTLSGTTMRSKANVDPALTYEGLSVRATDYAGDTNPGDPSLSSIYASLEGLPPLLIHVGSHEILLDDALRLAARAGSADVDVRLHVWPHMPHVFPTFLALLDEASQAVDEAAGFIIDALRKAQAH